MAIPWWVLASGSWAVLTMLATLAVVHDEWFAQKHRQRLLALVWLLPFIGALMALVAHWRSTGAPDSYTAGDDDGSFPANVLDGD